MTASTNQPLDKEKRFFYSRDFTGDFLLVERKKNSIALDFIGRFRDEELAREYCTFKNTKDGIEKKATQKTKEGPFAS